ncbi:MULTISPECIES: hypothetical protein [Nocardia]|uniref:hypothetical protein n=1 Tax=Nocardia TaxID=1817 RepID=UPI002453AB9C|nr:MULTISPECIES: hypothetical protein [Nocardia]
MSGQYDDIDAFDAARVIRELEAMRQGSGQRALAIRDAGKRRSNAVRDYEKARARVRKRTVGSAQAKDDEAIDPEVDRLREQADDAKIAERYANNLSDIHDSDQSNLQSQLKLIERVLGIGGTNR